MASVRPSRLSTELAAAIRPSSGSSSESLLPPVKLYFGKPVHLAAPAGIPAGTSGVKSNAVLMQTCSSFLIFCLVFIAGAF